MNPITGQKTLQELIQACLDNGLIDGCEQNEQGRFTLKPRGPIAYWPNGDHLRLYLQYLLDSGLRPERAEA